MNWGKIMIPQQAYKRQLILKKLDEIEKSKPRKFKLNRNVIYRLKKDVEMELNGQVRLNGIPQAQKTKIEAQVTSFLHDFVEASELDESKLERGYKGKAKLISKSNDLELRNTTTAILVSKAEILDLSDEFLQKTKDCDIVISTNYDENFTIGEVKQIYTLRKKLGASGRRIYFSDMDSKYSIESVLHANARLSTWASEINNATYDGRKLTELEKFMAAYKIVTNFAQYSLENEGENPALSRAISSILNYKKDDQLICCVGYASLLQALCTRLGITCEVTREQILNGDEDSSSYIGNHQTCRVFINDETYGVKGFFHSDPCYDSITDTNPNGTLLYALNPLDHFSTIEQSARIFNNGERACFSEYTPSDYEIAGVLDDETITNLLNKSGLYPSLVDIQDYVTPFSMEKAEKFIKKVIADRKENPNFTNPEDYVSDFVLKYLARLSTEQLEDFLANKIKLKQSVMMINLELANGKAMIAAYHDNALSRIPVKMQKQAMMIAQSAMCKSSKEAKQICASMFEKSSINAFAYDIIPLVYLDATNQTCEECENKKVSCKKLVERLKNSLSEYELRNADTSREYQEVCLPVVKDWIYQDMGVFDKMQFPTDLDYLKYNPWLKDLLCDDNQTFDSMVEYKLKMLRLINRTIGDSEIKKATNQAESEPGEEE